MKIIFKNCTQQDLLFQTYLSLFWKFLPNKVRLWLSSHCILMFLDFWTTIFHMKISDMDFISYVISYQHLIMRESKNMQMFTNPNSLNFVSAPIFRSEIVLYLVLVSLWNWYQSKKLMKTLFINGLIYFGTHCHCRVNNMLTKRNSTLPKIILSQL